MVSVIPLRNTDKIFYMVNFTRDLPIGNYYLYYLTSKTLVFRSGADAGAATAANAAP